MIVEILFAFGGGGIHTGQLAAGHLAKLCLKLLIELNGQRIGYALPKGQPVIAHIVLRNGASMIRKIVAK